jgi:hypothetical protein
MGDVRLSATLPAGQRGTMMPQRIYLIDSSACFAGEDPGRTNQARGGTASGRARLPARPTLAIGQAHTTTVDAAAYQQLRAELPALYRTGG